MDLQQVHGLPLLNDILAISPALVFHPQRVIWKILISQENSVVDLSVFMCHDLLNES